MSATEKSLGKTIQSLPFPTAPEARVRHSMILACKVITTKGGFPTKEKPLTLRSGPAIEQMYLWTAIMVLHDKKMKKTLDKNAIRISSSFSPDKEIGLFSTFSRSSLYEREFKQYLTDDMFDLEGNAQQFDETNSSILERRRQEELNKQAEERRQAELRAQEAERKKQENKIQEEQNAAERAKVLLEQYNRDFIRKIRDRDCFSIDLLTVEDFLRKGIDINYQDTEGKTPFMYALAMGRDNVAEFLHNTGKVNLSLKDKNGKSAKDYVLRTSVLYDVIYGKEDSLINNLPTPSVPSSQHQASSSAATSSDTSWPYTQPHEELLPLPTASNYSSTSQSSSSTSRKGKKQPKHSFSVEENSFDLFQYVQKPDAKCMGVADYLSLGADINYQDSNGFSILMAAIDSHNERIAEYLLTHGANPLLENKYHDRAINIAETGSPIKKILRESEQMAQLSSHSPIEKNSILLCEYVKKPRVKIEKIANLLNSGANINYQDLNGYSALMFAADAENERVVEYLLKKGANPVLCNKNGDTARDMVSSNSNIFHVPKKNENKHHLLSKTPRDRNSILLHQYVCKPNVKIQKISEYLSMEIDIDYQDSNGYSVLMNALDSGNVEIAKLLLAAGANPLLKDIHGNTARTFVLNDEDLLQTIRAYELLFTTSANDLSGIKLILNEAPSLIDFQGPGGYSALLIAVEQNMLDAVEYLLSLNADLTLTCDDGRSVWDIAHDENIKYLLTKARSHCQGVAASSTKSSVFFNPGINNEAGTSYKPEIHTDLFKL